MSQEEVALITWSAVLSTEFKGITGTQCPGGVGGGRGQAFPLPESTHSSVCRAKVGQGRQWNATSAQLFRGTKETGRDSDSIWCTYRANPGDKSRRESFSFCTIQVGPGWAPVP